MKSQIKITPRILNVADSIPGQGKKLIYNIHKKIFEVLTIRPYLKKYEEDELKIRWKRNADDILRDSYVYDKKACTDIVILFLSLANAKGFKTNFVKIKNGSKVHSIAEILIDKEWYSFDASSRKNPKLMKGRFSNKGDWKLWKRGKDSWDIGITNYRDTKKLIENNKEKSKKAVAQLKALQKMIKGKEIRLAAEWPEKWQVLISTILSAVTKDETTISVCEVLFKKYPSPEKLALANFEDITKIIRRVNYHKTKAKHIIETCKIIAEERGKIEDNIEGLLKYPGVGRKVGNVYLAEALKSHAIGVDTHITRISQKLGWTKNKNPHKIEKDLEELFPRKYWRSINYIIVSFGRIYSTSRRREDEIFEKVKLIK